MCMWGRSSHLHRRHLPATANGRKDLPCHRKEIPRLLGPHSACSPPHRSHAGLTFYQTTRYLARAAVRLTFANGIPDPTHPSASTRVGRRLSPDSRFWGNYGEDTRRSGVYPPCWIQPNTPVTSSGRIEMCLFGLLARSVEVWAPWRSWKPMVAAVLPLPDDHRSIRIADALPYCN